MRRRSQSFRKRTAIETDGRQPRLTNPAPAGLLVHAFSDTPVTIIWIDRDGKIVKEQAVTFGD